MFPGMNPRMMKQAMKRMGIQQAEIEATEVIIKTPDKDIIITSPQVSKVNMMGQETFQIVGEIHEREKASEPMPISDDDVAMVAEQAGVNKQAAKEALKKASGNIAEAILALQQ